MKWESISLEEQETIINFDYYEKTLKIYTSRASVYNRLNKKIGIPFKYHINKGLIYGADWEIPFNDRKKIIKALNSSNYLMAKGK